MPLFTFYPMRADGASTAFETYDLPDDEAARVRAQRVLQDHASAVEVAVWHGERKVCVVARAAAAE